MFITSELQMEDRVLSIRIASQEGAAIASASRMMEMVPMVTPVHSAAIVNRIGVAAVYALPMTATVVTAISVHSAATASPENVVTTFVSQVTVMGELATVVLLDQIAFLVDAATIYARAVKIGTTLR